MDFNADLALFYTDFAETALFGAAPIQGIFDTAYVDALGVAGATPVFQCAASDIGSLVPGTSTLTLRSASWLVIGVEDDGTGVALVRLQRT